MSEPAPTAQPQTPPQVETSAKRQDAPKPKTDAAHAPPQELERLRQEAQQAKDQYLRTLAEFDNAKKRLSREKEEFARFASESVIRSLLPIIDSLDQALVAIEKASDPQAIVRGVELIHRQLLGLLDREGVARIASIGQAFDPHQHEAVAQVDAAAGVADGTVTEEVQVGYTMHGKVLRPAMVKVARKTAHGTRHTADSTEQLGPEPHQQTTNESHEVNP